MPLFHKICGQEISLAPILADPEGRHAVFIEIYSWATLVMDYWKYHHYDTSQVENLAGCREHAEVESRLRSRLIDH